MRFESISLKSSNEVQYASLSQHEHQSSEDVNGVGADRFRGIEGEVHELQSSCSQSNLVLEDDDDIGFMQRPFPHHRDNRCCPCRLVLSLRCLSCSLIIGLFITMAITIPMIINLKTEIETTDNICVTESCVNAASTFLKSLDTSVDPCDDFYQFTCGGWEKHHPLPSGHATWNNFNVIWNQNQAILKGLLDDIKTTDKSTTDWKSKVYYDSCLDLDAMNVVKGEPLIQILQEIGGWSLDNSWDPISFNLSKLLLHGLKYGVSPLLNMYVTEDIKNSTNHVLEFGEGTLSLDSREYYLNKTQPDHIKIYNGYLDLMVGVAEQLGINTTRAQEKLTQVFVFEERLAELMMPIEERRDTEKNYNKLKLKDLSELSDLYNWLPVIQEFVSPVEDVVITDAEPIVITAMDYLKNISQIVKETDPEVIQNFYAWHMIAGFLKTLGQPYIDIRNKYKKIKYGVDGSCIERWRSCVSIIDGTFGDNLGRLFIMKQFDNTSKVQANDVVHSIKKSMKQTLLNADWMDEKTTQRAIFKVDSVKEKIGYPSYLFNMTRINGDYKDLKLDPSNNYFENLHAIILFSIIDEIKHLRKHVDKNDWSTTAPTVNAYYSPTSNKIVFPAGILRPPFFAPNLPPSVRFGSIGFVVGHELTHGFDDHGRKFDSDGNMNDWWENSTAENFVDRSKCIEDQFSSYKMFGLNLNGQLTLGENIADGGGVNIAHRAYMSWKASDPNSNREQVLPGLPYTHQQLFFMSFAQLWCQVSTEESMKELIQTNAHPPSKYRVIGTVSNSKEFAEAFQCSKSSKMNPSKKCTVW